jgi:hypothetical protein
MGQPEMLDGVQQKAQKVFVAGRNKGLPRQLATP